jgi:hypothetical protein
MGTSFEFQLMVSLGYESDFMITGSLWAALSDQDGR